MTTCALASPTQAAFTPDHPVCPGSAGHLCAGSLQAWSQGSGGGRVSEQPPSAAAQGDSGTVLAGLI